MIISQTPYRMSLSGGGTDLPAFYEQEYGAVLSLTLARHMYVTIHERFERNIRVAYSKTEICDGVDQLQHELVREAMRVTEIDEPLEITTIGDVPAGTGMGSSSSLVVGLLHALYAYRGQMVDRSRLAEEACQIEIDVLGKPIGKQDQYAAAFGGVNYIRFNPDGSVDIEPVPVKAETIREFESRVMLLYTDKTRSADDILKRQSQGTTDRMAILREMRDLCEDMRDAMCRGDMDDMGRVLHEGWCLKRSLGFGISSEQIDHWYETAREAGAQGGKLLGAGGGGFVMLMAPPDRHDEIHEALGCPRKMDFAVDRLGSRLLFVSN